MSVTFYWHDYETFGPDPARDRPVQFAGLRTDLDFNPISKPLVVYCRPTPDMLPHPQACLITGITPQLAASKGVIEAEFMRMIHAEFSQAGTCALGYNSLRFDDEFTRYGFYRNFFDPYAREWQNGNSRWDIIDMIRLCYALRPDGITWPRHADGKPSFKLEDLTTANDISHTAAHDALSDVHATIEMAKLIKTRQPKLYHYLFNNRDKKALAQQLNLAERQAVLHSSAMYPAEYGCTALVVPVAMHPTNRNSVIVYDLRYDPQSLLELSSTEIQARLFTKTSELPEGSARIPLKEIHLNKCPVLAPLSTLNDAAAQRTQIDISRSLLHLEKIKQAKSLDTKLSEVYAKRDLLPSHDPDLSLYSGGFFNDEDRQRMNEIRNTPLAVLAEKHFAFDDARLPEMLFRYRARNYPKTLNPNELQRWEEFRIERLTQAEVGGGITLDIYEQQLQDLAGQSDITDAQMEILEQLAEYGSAVSEPYFSL